MTGIGPTFFSPFLGAGLTTPNPASASGGKACPFAMASSILRLNRRLMKNARNNRPAAMIPRMTRTIRNVKRYKVDWVLNLSDLFSGMVAYVPPPPAGLPTQPPVGFVYVDVSDADVEVDDMVAMGIKQ